MTRAGSLCVGLTIALWWCVSYAVIFRWLAIVTLVAGLSLLVLGREPRPHCCEHCPTMWGPVDDAQRP